jgi:feruloyl-CoA synthase
MTTGPQGHAPHTAPDPLFAPAEVEVSYRADGSVLLRSPRRLGAHAATLGEPLRRWAREAPDRDFLIERDERVEGGWRRVSYAAAHATARSIGQALLARGLGPERPVMVISDNSVDHALLALGALLVGVPIAPISAAYSLQSSDHGKLRVAFDALTPGLVYAEKGALFARALAALPSGPEVVTSDDTPGTTPFAQLAGHAVTGEVDNAAGRVGLDTVAKVLFTSGSTGRPKGVINTHRMLCSNQQGLLEGWPFLSDRPPVVVDWLPWSHTFGGNHNFNLVLWNGGTLCVDRGKPTPALIGETVATLREVSPTVYFNVPRGFDALLPHLERDEALCARFFARLDLLFYAAAALPEPTWARLTALARRVRGQAVPFVSAWGSTETSPLVTQVHFPIDRAGVIGLPVPGVEIKLTPSGSKQEIRVKGPCVSPGYWRDPERMPSLTDGEGFYCIGDAARLVDPADPRQGLAFDGRIAEDFKLSSGTWVHVGALRLALIKAAAPLVQDAVLAGHDRDHPTALLFLDPAACAALDPAAQGLAALAKSPLVREAITRSLRAHREQVAGQSSACVARVLLLDEPPSIDAGEITDKGYLNQRAILDRRAPLVALLDNASAPEVLQIAD